MENKEINNLVDFTEVKEQLIGMYNFNKHIKVELKPLGAKAILDYIDSKDKEIERLNNIIDKLEKWLDEKMNEYKEMEHDDAFVFEYVLEKLEQFKEGK